MSSKFDEPVIAFVWRPEEISSAVVETARQTATTAIYDLTAIELESVSTALLQADVSGDAIDFKISASQLGDPTTYQFLNEMNVRRIWVELHPALPTNEIDGLLKIIVDISEEFVVFPIVSQMEIIEKIINHYPSINNIVLKGNEASGFVSSETIFTLFSSVRKMISGRTEALRLFVWGGVALPEAAAAFLSVGCAGIVFESLHWLTDLVRIDDESGKRIAAIRPDHVDLIGLNLDVPFRVFNKGNSRAVRELKNFAGSLCGADVTDEARLSFSQTLQNKSISALTGTFGRDELIPIGIEASFASSFVRLFGNDTAGAIAGFIKKIDQCMAKSRQVLTKFSGSEVAREMGTKYPFIQGAMSWITDNPEFARRVADAGGLPTIALGLMDEKILDDKLGNLTQIMGGKPFGVNVITLAENPNRQVQLDWIRKIKPKFAVIAAGEPSHAADLLSAGIEVIYIAPNEELLRMAFQSGIRYVICEGHEAGGHVGQFSTLTLSQMIMELKELEPALFRDRRIILAGGVFNRETAFMAGMLGADAIQMGTVYLATPEITETHALTNLYQRMIVESRPQSTVITGEATGLRVRSLRSPRIDSICSLERDFAAGSENEASFRMKIEALSAGSLFVAARGLDKPGGAPLDEDKCVELGQFMSGACAGAVSEVKSIIRLHQNLAEAPLAENLPLTGPIREPKMKAETTETPSIRHGKVSPAAKAVPSYPLERIAITGMSVVNSLGNSPEEVWAACLSGKSGISPVPGTRWNHELFYHPRPRMPEKTYCKVGAFQSIEVTRKDIGIPPQDFRTMTDSTKITMWLARNAVEESGILDSDIPRERIAVLISQNSGEAAVTLQDVIIRGSLNKIISAVGRVVSLDPDTEKAIEEEVKSGRIAIDDTTLLGRLNCSAGGFICNKFGFMGPSFSVSAACATALVALYSAVQMIRNGIIDAAVVGGAEEFLTPMHFLEFSALGALAGLSGVDRPASETSRPFDYYRDGMVLGEGGGMIVIERESVARARNAKIHAFITTMGASNNNLGMVESSRITQEIAIRSSFKDIPYGPEGVGLVECHATSTRQGDVEEVQALKSFYRDNGKRTVLTSFKSQIGHTLGASGVNSLIRGVMAMKAGVYPATLNCKNPDPDLGIDDSGLMISSEPMDWTLPNGRQRRLQVNAFGFGGSNYVVQVEQSTEDSGTVLVSVPEPKRRESNVDLPQGISFFKTAISGRDYRISVVADDEDQATAKIAALEPVNNGSGLLPKRIKALARQGIFVAPEESKVNPLAFIFPGQGSHYAGMGHELYKNFPVVREWMDRAAQVAEFDLLHLLFFDKEEDLQKTRWQQPALFTMEFAMVQYLMSLGITPTALAGHSLGELTALCLAGVYSFEDGFRIVNMRAICMDKACNLNVDPGVMMAVDAPMDVINEIMARTDHVYITNLNSPLQIVLGGNSEKIKAVGAELKQRGFRSKLLRVSMAFHSPIMRCIHDELEEFISEIEFHAPKIPVISNTINKPFPADTSEIKKIVMAHLESPVYWMDNVRTMWNDFGIRLFVEVGPREILSNLISDTIEEAECIQTCLPSAEISIYKNALAQLYTKGHLDPGDSVKRVVFPGTEKTSLSPALPALREAVPQGNGNLALEKIVQREINAFMLDSFGRFIKPSILTAIKQQDAGFSESDLDRLLATLFPGIGNIPSPPHMRSFLPEAEPASLPHVAATEASPPPERSGQPDTTEAVIRIIMDATGYERNEIEPDMDLREDLSIRSSRLPVIIDSVENHFRIKIDLEDFMDVRTIRDISDRISKILSGGPKKGGPEKSIPVPKVESRSETKGEKKPLRRMVFKKAAIVKEGTQPVELDPLDTVCVLSAVPGTGLRKQIGKFFRREYGVNIAPRAFLHDISEPDETGFDFRNSGAADLTTASLSDIESLAGLAIILDDSLEAGLSGPEEVSGILESFFTLLKSFLESPAKKFAVLIHRQSQKHGYGKLLAEGILGMFLSAALEFSSVQFRTVGLNTDADLKDALRGALDRSQKVIETIFDKNGLFTNEGRLIPTRFAHEGRLSLGKEDVILFTGGCSGIIPFLAGSLVPFGCKMIFLGRTEIDPTINFDLVLGSPDPNETLESMIPESGGQSDDSDKKFVNALKSLDIVRTIRELKIAGIQAEYFTCDVVDADSCKRVVAEILAKYGRIDGVVHGAGILKDNFIRQMEREDFSPVLEVKFLGAWNLFKNIQGKELKFFVCLSSAAAIQGNPGQVNYACGNRAMSALMSYLGQDESSTLFKALMLPPIEGAGMAETPDIRLLMKRMNADYVHAGELGELFCRELILGSREDCWVMFLRSLPELPTGRLETVPSFAEPGIISGTTLFKPEQFPMIDAVSAVDMAHGELIANRAFSLEKDLWIRDHKPFKFMKYPLVSAIMALETFMEAASILYPQLYVRGIRDAGFLNILECQPGVPRPAVVTCRRLDNGSEKPECELDLSTKEISPSGRVLDRVVSNYKALVILDTVDKPVEPQLKGFPVATEELDSRPMDNAEVHAWYQGRTDMQNRYRILNRLDGTGQGCVRGHIIYEEIQDFSNAAHIEYRYSPYLLEALLQVVNFYLVMRSPEETKSMIPYKIGEMIFLRRCTNGENIVLEARMREQDEKGIIWDARGTDSDGSVVMYVRDLVMKWFFK